MLSPENQNIVYQLKAEDGFFSSKKFAIVVAEWNSSITDLMSADAQNILQQNYVPQKNITVMRVPGSFELTAAAAMLAKKADYDAIICLGCVIQGSTRHFEFICSAVAQGLTEVAIRYAMPVIFGVLTTDTKEQAQYRADGTHSKKGQEAALAALKMLQFRHSIYAPSGGKVGF